MARPCQICVQVGLSLTDVSSSRLCFLSECLGRHVLALPGAAYCGLLVACGFSAGAQIRKGLMAPLVLVSPPGNGGSEQTPRLRGAVGLAKSKDPAALATLSPGLDPAQASSDSLTPPAPLQGQADYHSPCTEPSFHRARGPQPGDPPGSGSRSRLAGA